MNNLILIFVTFLSISSAIANVSDNFQGQWQLSLTNHNTGNCSQLLDISVSHYVDQETYQTSTGVIVKYLVTDWTGSRSIITKDQLQMSDIFFEQNFSNNSYVGDTRINLSSWIGTGTFSLLISSAKLINNEWVYDSNLSLLLNENYRRLTIKRTKEGKYSNCKYIKN